MILNGKAEVDFIKWASYNYGEDSGDLAMMREVYRNALIIEFFDSIEYNKNSSLWDYCFFDCYWNKGLREYKQATIQAIKKANDLYNSRYENV
ncbi:hypothetical protein OBK29_04065 [Empedobacter falsenii]|uniref:hypothetical protein n=1 Tax=Empedobacter falsenii TaxID=343874 RepID=UPI003A7FEF5C